MTYFNKILLNVHPDFTDMDAVDRTAKLASKTSASIKSVHVVEDYPEQMSEWWNVCNPLKLHNEIVRDRQGFLDSIVARVREAGVERVESTLRWGQEFLEITREVLKGHHDLVVTTARHEGKLARTMRGGSRTGGLCRYTPSSVWVAQNRLEKHSKRLVAALGADKGKVKCEGLNAKILKTAASLAESEGDELHIIHALPRHGGKGLKGDRQRLNGVAHLENLRHEINEGCDALLGDASSILSEEHIHLITGSPTAVIPEFVKKQGMNLLVIGTSARNGIPGLLVGNTAEKVAKQVDCGVLVVKPDDFVSWLAREEGISEQPAAA